MNEIRIIIDGRESAYNAPSCFDEMRREQLLALCRMTRNGDETDFYAAMSGIDAETWNSIPFEQRYHVKRLFDFAFTRSPEISRQLLAFLLCYKSLRKRNLEDKYPNVFARRPRKPKTSPNQQPPAFSWVSVHRDIMGDQFYDEGKFFASNVHVILGRLDRVIRNKKN